MSEDENYMIFIRKLPDKTKDGHILGEYRCGRCGKTKVASMSRVRTGKVRSCGCLITATKNVTHGMRNTKEYNAWQGLKGRATNKRSKDYRRYGGLDHDADLLASFEIFYRAIGPCPSPDHSVDRIDNTKGYKKDNIRWATREEQQRNRSDSKRVEIKGMVFDTKTDAAEYFGVTKTTVTRWEHGAFDKRRNSQMEPKSWIKTLPKYNNAQKSGRNTE